MVQEFHVVRCFCCQSFQVQQVKKANRWSCKLCGEKQSLLKEFGRGSGADCRRHVQKLNAMRGAVMEEQEHNAWSLWKQAEANGEDEPEEERDPQVTHTQVSCWSKYLDTPEEVEPEEEENVLMERQKLHGNNMNDRRVSAVTGHLSVSRVGSKTQLTDSCSDRKRRGRTDSWTPEQPNWSSLTHISPRPPSLNHISPRPPSLTHISPRPPSLTHISPRPPSLNHISPRPPSLTHISPRPPSLTHISPRPPSLNHISPRPPSLTHISPRPPSLNHISPRPPSLTHISPRPPSLTHISPPSKRAVGTSAVSRWAQFLSSDCQVSEEEEPAASGWSQSVGGAVPLSCNDVITPPSSRPRPLLPVSSMFQSGDEFNFDDDFLND